MIKNKNKSPINSKPSISVMFFSKIISFVILLGVLSCSKQKIVYRFDSSKEIEIPKHNIKLVLQIEDDEFCFIVNKDNYPLSYLRLDIKSGERSNSISFFDDNGVFNEIWDLNGDGLPDYKIAQIKDTSIHYVYIEDKFQKIENVDGHRGVNGKQIEFKDGRYQFK